MLKRILVVVAGIALALGGLSVAYARSRGGGQPSSPSAPSVTVTDISTSLPTDESPTGDDQGEDTDAQGDENDQGETASESQDDQGESDSSSTDQGDQNDQGKDDQGGDSQD